VLRSGTLAANICLPVSLELCVWIKTFAPPYTPTLRSIRRIDVRTLERAPSRTYTGHVAQILRFETRRQRFDDSAGNENRISSWVGGIDNPSEIFDGGGKRAGRRVLRCSEYFGAQFGFSGPSCLLQSQRAACVGRGQGRGGAGVTALALVMV